MPSGRVRVSHACDPDEPLDDPEALRPAVVGKLTKASIRRDAVSGIHVGVVRAAGAEDVRGAADLRTGVRAAERGDDRVLVVAEMRDHRGRVAVDVRARARRSPRFLSTAPDQWSNTKPSAPAALRFDVRIDSGAIQAVVGAMLAARRCRGTRTARRACRSARSRRPHAMPSSASPPCPCPAAVRPARVVSTLRLPDLERHLTRLVGGERRRCEDERRRDGSGNQAATAADVCGPSR